MTFYLIRHKRTKEWISALDDNGSIRARGFTHAHLSSTETPRLFHNMNSAKAALTVWLRGKLATKRTPIKDMDSYYKGEDIEMILTHDPSRRRQDMEIVKCNIVVLEVDIFKSRNDDDDAGLCIP